MTWLCKCGLLNSGLNEPGSCAKAFNESIDKHYQITPNKPDFSQAVVAANWVSELETKRVSDEFRVNVRVNDTDRSGEAVTPQEELFAKFYNQEKILVKDMDSVQLREHRDELATIAFEAKARLVATDDETRERSSKSKANKEWILPADNSQVSSDAVNAVKTRTARMNKVEKLRSQLLAAGIDEATVKEMVKNLERKATEKDVKAITFNKPSVEQAVIVVETKKSTDVVANAEPFNPASLFGK